MLRDPRLRQRLRRRRFGAVCDECDNVYLERELDCATKDTTDTYNRPSLDRESDNVLVMFVSIRRL